MGNDDYYSVRPFVQIVIQSDPDCGNLHYVEPRYKSAAAKGYRIYAIYKNTVTNKKCWKDFNDVKSPVAIGYRQQRRYRKAGKGQIRLFLWRHHRP